MQYAASYYDGVTARAQTVAIDVTDDGVAISDADGTVLSSWPAGRVILAELPRGGEPVRLGLDGTTARLVVDDPGVVETLRPMAPQLYRRVRLSWSGLARIAAWAGAAVVAVAFIILVVVPSLSRQMAAVTPDAVRQRIGAATLRQLPRLLPIDRSGPPQMRQAYCGYDRGRDALQAMLVRLTADMALRVVVVNTEVVNAFALPGDMVVLTQGLIDNASSAEEVAGVIAHEMGHVAHDHPIESMYRTATVSALAGLVTGDAAGGILITGLGQWVLNTGYSRAAEREADQYALERLYAAGIDSSGLERFFARLMEERDKDAGPFSRMLSTHPPTRERLEAVRRADRVTGRVFGDDDEPLAQLRRICWNTQPAPRPISTP